jgi:RHS repeat-associated protein
VGCPKLQYYNYLTSEKSVIKVRSNNHDEISGEGNSYTAEFWQYDPRLGRRWNVDPIDQISISNYATFRNNPIFFIDPSGASANPIYDTDGSFLGTDDKGISGDAIVMDKKDFTQGMKHDDAVALDKGVGALATPESKQKFANHYYELPSRPDFDGFVTIEEGVKWAKEHPNLDNDNIEKNGMGNATPNDYLYLDASKLNFGMVQNTDLKQGVVKEVNLLYETDFTSSASIATTYALGRTQLRLLDQNGTVEVINGAHNIYNWDKGGGFIRSNLIKGERLRTGINDSHGFPLYIYGTGKVKVHQDSGIRFNAY